MVLEPTAASGVYHWTNIGITSLSCVGLPFRVLNNIRESYSRSLASYTAYNDIIHFLSLIVKVDSEHDA